MNNIQKVVKKFASDHGNLLKTALNNYHQSALGGKMVPFAGYEMPV